MKAVFTVLVVIVALLVSTAPALAQTDVLVNVGSPDTPFPQNKQNEPSIAIDANNPNILAAGSNDEIDLAPCVGSSCPFTAGVGLSGIYFSFDGGATWTQPTYTGWSARTGTPQVGPIGTLPNYYEKGLVSDGDPILAFGPSPDENGVFSWGNGSRLYYANLTSNFETERKEGTFRGYEAIAVSHTYNVAAAAAGDSAAWSDPVIVAAKRQSQTTFSDKESLWADNAESSPYFGNVYVCWVSFRSLGSGPEPVMFSRSTDGGESFSNPKQLTEAANNDFKGRQGCTIRTDSKGAVYVFWEGTKKGQSIHYMARSTDGGVKFSKKQEVAEVVDVGALDPVQGRLTFDGVAGARTASFPSVDIANGAPTGTGATDTIVLVWPDGRNGLNHEEALLQYSSNGGDTWSTPVNVADVGDRPNFPALAISPDGTDLYLAYNAFLGDWQSSLSGVRQFQAVVRHADFGSGPSNWSTVHRGAIGDGRASSANSLAAEFLGDYNYVDAMNGYGAAIWVDARNAAVCDGVNAYRSGLAGIGPAVPPPAPATDCAPTFGNTDIYAIAIADTDGASAPAAGGATAGPGTYDESDRQMFLPLLSGLTQ